MKYLGFVLLFLSSYVMADEVTRLREALARTYPETALAHEVEQLRRAQVSPHMSKGQLHPMEQGFNRGIHRAHANWGYMIKAVGEEIGVEFFKEEGSAMITSNLIEAAEYDGVPQGGVEDLSSYARDLEPWFLSSLGEVTGFLISSTIWETGLVNPYRNSLQVMERRVRAQKENEKRLQEEIKKIKLYKEKEQTAKLESLATQGNAQAQFKLGVMYESGEGVIKSQKEAAKLFLLSAQQGNAQAQFRLGRMYCSGRGVPEEIKMAHMLFNIASTMTESIAISYMDFLECISNDELLVDTSFLESITTVGGLRDYLERRMTKSEIEEAQQLALELVQSHDKKENLLKNKKDGIF